MRNTALKKITQKMRVSLASKEDVADIIALYQDLFSSEESLDFDTLEHQLGLDIDFTGEEKDPGVKQEQSMTITQLAADLGFLDNRPFLFNTHRHFSGSLNAWQTTETNKPERYYDREIGSTDEEMVPLDLHWHQIVGVHVLARQCFRETSSSEPVGTGIFDEVGLGKSFQSLAFVGFLMDNVNRQLQGKQDSMPPLLRKSDHLGF